MLGFALAKVGWVCVPGGFCTWGAGSPPSAPSFSIQAPEPGGSWILSLSAEGRGEGEQASQLKMCAHGGEGHMRQEGHWGA